MVPKSKLAVVAWLETTWTAGSFVKLLVSPIRYWYAFAPVELDQSSNSSADAFVALFAGETRLGTVNDCAFNKLENSGVKKARQMKFDLIIILEILYYKSSNLWMQAEAYSVEVFRSFNREILCFKVF